MTNANAGEEARGAERDEKSQGKVAPPSKAPTSCLDRLLCRLTSRRTAPDPAAAQLADLLAEQSLTWTAETPTLRDLYYLFRAKHEEARFYASEESKIAHRLTKRGTWILYGILVALAAGYGAIVICPINPKEGERLLHVLKWSGLAFEQAARGPGGAPPQADVRRTTVARITELLRASCAG